MPSLPIVTSIHDVAPPFLDEVSALWRLCRASGATPALLVVPNWHGHWPIEKSPEFIDWLHERCRDGAEIILHGERHDETGLPRSLGASVRAFGRTAREGEFLTLGFDAAAERIDRGLRLLRQLGFSPLGFIPPAWLAREATHAAVKGAGLQFSEDAHAVRLHERGVRLHAPALRWSGRTTARARASEFVAAARLRVWMHKPLLRLALHPQDLQHPVTARSVERDVPRWLAAREAIAYHELAATLL